MGALFAAGPVWSWLVLAAVIGGLLVLAWPAAVDLWWAAWDTIVGWVVRFCLVVGVLVLVAGAFGVLLVATGAVEVPGRP